MTPIQCWATTWPVGPQLGRYQLFVWEAAGQGRGWMSRCPSALPRAEGNDHGTCPCGLHNRAVSRARHGSSGQLCFNAGPASATLARHWTRAGRSFSFGPVSIYSAVAFTSIHVQWDWSAAVADLVGGHWDGCLWDPRSSVYSVLLYNQGPTM